MVHALCQEKKLKRLKSELKKSKQQVVQNLVKCRAIDTAIKQSTLTNDAIKHHISVHPVEMTGLNGSAGDNTITSFRGFHGLSAPYLGTLIFSLLCQLNATPRLTFYCSRRIFLLVS